MSLWQWLRGRDAARDTDPVRPADTAGPAPDTAVDIETGEILDRSAHADTTATANAAPPTPRTVVGERTIPSVNRERSVQARVGHALTIGALVLLVGGALVWYYATQFSRADDVKAAARKAADARASGESRVAPLGRVDPPGADSAARPTPVGFGGLLGPPPAPPLPSEAAPVAQPGPPTKTPGQLALERQLGQPVLLRGQAAGQPPASGAPGPAPTVVPTGPSNIAAILGGMPEMPGPGAGPVDPPQRTTEDNTLTRMLRPTPTPAVTAQVLPTRRLLLPKGAFVDCTLETAIDSTVDGMVTCIGASDVYSADGKVVLLERGTKYVGERRGEVKQGQARVFVLWNEARTPTGVVVALGSPGTDQLGRAGLPGYIDSHFWDRFGAAILVSVIDGALQVLAAGQHGATGGTAVVLNPQGTRDVMTEVLKNTISVPPTVVKNQGDRIQVLVARDVDFRAVYALRTDGQ